jgi:putative drug exporter of the RND superfamily
MTSFTRWVLAHKRIVIGFWLALTLVGMASAGPATSALKQKFSVPGREGWKANAAILRDYGTGGDLAPIVPVVTLPAGRTVDAPGVKQQLAGLEARLRAALPGSRTASYAGTGSRAFVSHDGRTTFLLAYPRPGHDAFNDNPDAVRRATGALHGATLAGAPVRVTGIDALQQTAGGGNGPGVLLEAVLGGLGALVVLGFVFASFLALVPILMAVVAIMTTFLLVWGLTGITDVSPIVQFLVALIGLGVAIDYALLVVVRWREERAHGRTGDEAVVRAMETAGRAVVFSGTTVAIGLLALVALPLPFLRSVGYGGMLIPLVSVVVAITLLPVVLATVGSRLDWPHRRTDDQASRAWTRWAELVVRHRWVASMTALVALAALVVAATSLNLGEPNPSTLAKQGEAKAGLVALQRSGIGAGAMTPVETIAPAGSAGAVRDALGRLDAVSGAVAPAGQGWSRNGTALVDAIPIADGSTPAGRALVATARDAAHAAAPDALVGGRVSQSTDFVAAVYGNFPLMIALIAIVTFLLLARAFRSLLLPLKAVILNVVSVAAAWGVLTLVWQEGHGSHLIWGIASTGSITQWIPLMVFAFLFGLSMDYEVFILARMREEYDATGDTNVAVVRGIGRTGRLVTSAALILFLAFVSLASGPQTDVKIMATGLAAGILLDATVIRALLVPAVVSLFGRWNWWLPRWPARVLRVEPSLPQRAAAGESAG